MKIFSEKYKLAVKKAFPILISCFLVLSSYGLTDGLGESEDLRNPEADFRLFSFVMSGKSRIGPQNVLSTAVEKGTLFVSSKGGGDCTKDNPCNLEKAIETAVPGEIIFLAGGVYFIGEEGLLLDTTGKSDSTITFESLPNQRAIFDGSLLPNGNGTVVTVTGNWNVLRNLRFRNFPENGVRVSGNYNLLDGIVAYNNKSSGIHIWGTYDYPYGASGSWNTIQNSVCYSNSDAGLEGGPYNDGDNADGISVSSGEGNMILNNIAYNNSDDGIDVWRSTNSVIAKNIVHDNGEGSMGNGNGIKAGGASPGEGAIVYQNVAYNNRGNGFDHNGSPRVSFYNNTSFKNSRGYVVGQDNTAINNISYQDDEVIAGSAGNMSHNSWQLSIENPVFSSKKPSSRKFLWLTKESSGIDAGKYVGISYHGNAPDIGAFEFIRQ